jgi:hypothetical protein
MKNHLAMKDDWAMKNHPARPQGLRYAKAIALLVLAFSLLVPAAPASAQILPFLSRLAGPFAGPRNQQNQQNQQNRQHDHADPGHYPQLLPGQGLTGGLGGARQAAAATPETPGRPPIKVSNESGISPDVWNVIVGSCAGGAFLGTFAVVSAASAAAAPAAATAVAAGPVAAPLAASAIALAAGTGCIMGVSTAVISLGAIHGWHLLTE